MMSKIAKYMIRNAKSLLIGFSLFILSACSSVNFEAISLPQIIDAKFIETQRSGELPLISGPTPAFKFGSTSWYIEIPASKFLLFKNFGENESEILKKIRMTPPQVEDEDSTNRARSLEITMYVRNEVDCTLLSSISGQLEYNNKEITPTLIEITPYIQGDSHENRAGSTIFLNERDPLTKRDISFGFCKGAEGISSRSWLKIKFRYATRANPYAVYTMQVGQIREANEVETRKVVFGFAPAIGRNESWH